MPSASFKELGAIADSSTVDLFSMSAPYWGLLPPPNVVRGNLLKRPENSSPNRVLVHNISTKDTKGQDPIQQQPTRQNRYSTQTAQTDAPTLSTQSPFASPTASEFRGDGLALRPPSFGYSSTEGGHNRDYLEKRRRRESRSKEYYDDINSMPPPAAPDAPRNAPAKNYTRPYNSGPVPALVQRSNGPAGSQQVGPEHYNRQNGQYLVDGRPGEGRRSSKGKGEETKGGVEWDPSKPERLDTRRLRQDYSEDKRRREWAPEKSPLQRLELTLDSITKEKKRARVAKAEIHAREAKAGRGGERAAQNSVRFRNRPVAKAGLESIAQAEPQSLPEAGFMRNLSNEQQIQLQRSADVEAKRPVEPNVSSTTPQRGFDYHPKPEVLPDPWRPEDILVQRKSSTRERSSIPVATAVTGAAGAGGLVRGGSNKLKKDPPGDPWYNRRMAAEQAYQEVTLRRQSIEKRQEDPPPVVMSSRGTGSQLRTLNDRELPAGLHAGIPGRHFPDESALNDERDENPVRLGSIRKIEQLIGQMAPATASSSNSPTKQRIYGRRPGQPENDPSDGRQPTRELRTELVTVNGIKYSIPPTAIGADTNSNRDNNRHFQLPNPLNRKMRDADPGAGMYVPSKRLDEWKKADVALLAGELLDLSVTGETETEKDKTWWEVGKSGRRRRSSTTKRKAEAYGGEYDDINGKNIPIFKPLRRYRIRPPRLSIGDHSD